MMHSFKELFEDSVQPMRPVDEGATAIDAVRDYANQIEAECLQFARKVQRTVMGARVETLAKIGSNPSAAVARADFQGFGRFALLVDKAAAESIGLAEYHQQHYVDFPWATVPEVDRREEAVAITLRLAAALDKRIEAQFALSAFFSELAQAAKARFYFLTTAPDAYQSYAERVVRDNPTIMDYLAR